MRSTPSGRALIADQVAKMRLQGGTERQIAARLGISQPTVHRYLARLAEEWRESAAASMAELKARQVAELQLARAEAWAEWERSKDATKEQARTEREATGVHGVSFTEDKEIQRERLADARYLAVIVKSLQTEARITGTDVPEPETLRGDLALWVTPPVLSIEEWTRQVQALPAKL
jgi:transposase